MSLPFPLHLLSNAELRQIPDDVIRAEFTRRWPQKNLCLNQITSDAHLPGYEVTDVWIDELNQGLQGLLEIIARATIHGTAFYRFMPAPTRPQWHPNTPSEDWASSVNARLDALETSVKQLQDAPKEPPIVDPTEGSADPGSIPT